MSVLVDRHLLNRIIRIQPIREISIGDNIMSAVALIVAMS
jgi:pyridoxine 5'-phosphate synthase PdxJ